MLYAIESSEMMVHANDDLVEFTENVSVDDQDGEISSEFINRNS